MRCVKILLLLALTLCVCILGRAATTNSLVWQTANDRVSADIRGEALWPLLADIAHQTGWHIFIEPGVDRQADVKFKNLSPGDALKKLLGDLNFAFVPQTNGPDFLYVFATTMQAATRAVTVASAKHRHVANQLMVKLKPGADIDALAKKYGAKVIARNDKLHTYLLEFPDAAATDAALAQMQNDSDVEAVDYNYVMDPPVTPLAVASSPTSAPKLTLDKPTDGDPCNPIIGLIDTGYQTSSDPLDQFVMKQVSVVDNDDCDPTGITHGTAMAKTILNAISQASGGHTGARILPIKAIGCDGTATSWNIAVAYQKAVDSGATVINMSLGGPDNSTVLSDLIAQGNAQGIVVFASAGNTPVNTPTYPAANPGVNAVTALSAPGQLASYANYGSFVEMALPGTSYVFLNNQAYVVQGTSPAAAYATGVAVGTKSVNCGSWSQIISAMTQKFPVPKQ